MTKKLDELNELLDEKVNAGMARTQAWVDVWQDSLRYFFGEQLAHKKEHKNWEWVIINYIWPSAMQEIAKIAKNHPKIIAHPWEDSDTDSAEAWQSKLNWDWQKGINKTGMRIEQVRAILDGKIFGYRVSKLFWDGQCYWDDNQKKWVGDIKHRLWHPALFWASDEENIHDGDCGTVRYVSLDWAIRQWPKFEKELREEANEFASEYGTGKPVEGSRSYSGTTEALAAGRSGGGTEKKSGRLPSALMSLILRADKTGGGEIPKGMEVVRIEDSYLKDYSTKHRRIEQDIPKEELMVSGQIQELGGLFYGPDGKPITIEGWPKRTVSEYDEPSYPNGRNIIRCGQTILNPEEEEQKYSYSRWPFITQPHYLLPHMWQGVNAVSLYKSTQDMINVTVSYLFNCIKHFGAPKVGVEQGAIDSPKGRNAKPYKIPLGAGGIIRFARDALAKGRFKIFNPPSPSAAVPMLYQLFTQEFKNLTGLQSISRGEKESGSMTATEAQHLAISSHDRISLQSVFEEEWVRELMMLDAEISQLNYDVGRFVRIIGEDRIAGAIQITSRLKEARFDISIEAGSQLPFDAEKKQMRYLKAYELLSNPNPNPLLPDVLRVLEISNAKKVLSQHQGWSLYMQFQQLYEAVKAGQVTIQQAVAMLVNKAVSVYAMEQRNQLGGQTNAGSVQQMRQGGRQGENSKRPEQVARTK